MEILQKLILACLFFFRKKNEILIQRSSFYSYPTAVVNFTRDRALPDLISYILQDNKQMFFK